MIIPDYLKQGDKVGIVAPAGHIHYPDDIVTGLNILKHWGLSPAEGRTPALTHFQFAGTDEQRLTDMQQMLDDPEVKAIIAVRGGYGCSRILHQIDFTAFKKQPKWLIGFSDLTLLLCHLQTLGYASIHGPMVKQIGSEGSGSATEALRQLLFGIPASYSAAPFPGNRPGKAAGQLVGGNLCLFAHTLGSPSEVDTRGKILLLEDVGEQLYNLDRMLWQLQRAGKLDQLTGLVAGQFTENKGTPESFGQDAYAIIAHHTRQFPYPVGYNFPIGHVPDNKPVVIGADYELSVGENGTILRPIFQKEEMYSSR